MQKKTNKAWALLNFLFFFVFVFTSTFNLASSFELAKAVANAILEFISIAIATYLCAHEVSLGARCAKRTAKGKLRRCNDYIPKKNE